MMNYFAGVETRDQLKAEYKRLAKKWHPDLPGGSNEVMAQINAQYDELDKRLPNETADGKRYNAEPVNAPESFRAAVVAVQNIDDITVELCGSWLWVTGNTLAHREILKAAGYRWSANKRAWYWHEEGYSRKGRKRYSMDEIRSMHGSERIQFATPDTLPA